MDADMENEAGLQEETPKRELVAEPVIVEEIVCPDCAGTLVSNIYYIGGRGYVTIWECSQSLSELSKCSYRRVV